MKNLYFLLVLAVFATGCQKENTPDNLFNAQQTASATNLMDEASDDRAACTTSDCSWEIVAQGVAPEFSQATVIVQRFENGQLMCEQSFNFAPPICNTCWLSVPVSEGSQLRIFANVFTEGTVNTHGKAYVYLRNPQTGQKKHLALAGGGTSAVWITDVNCDSNLEQVAPQKFQEDPLAE